MSSPSSISHSKPMKARATVGHFMAFLLVVGSQVAGADPLDRVGARERLIQADLIVQTTVLDVSHRNSDISSQDHVRLPHTFVTLRIEQVLKGTRKPGESITLRFLGGPDGNGRRLFVPGIPQFIAGDQDILFIRDNGAAASPLVGSEQGRLRIVRGEVYDAFGRELWLAPGGEFLSGERQLDLRRTGYPAVTPATDRMTIELPPRSLRPDPRGLSMVLGEAILRLAAGGELTEPRAYRDARINERFHFLKPKPVSPRPPVAVPDSPVSGRSLPSTLEQNQ